MHNNSNNNAATADNDHNELDIIANKSTQDTHAIDTGYSSDPGLYKEAMLCSDAAQWAKVFAEEMATHERNGM